MIYKHFEEKDAEVIADQADDNTVVFMIRKKDGTLLASINVNKTGTTVNIMGIWDVAK